MATENDHSAQQTIFKSGRILRDVALRDMRMRTRHTVSSGEGPEQASNSSIAGGGIYIDYDDLLFPLPPALPLCTYIAHGFFF